MIKNKINEECGIFGIYQHENAANLVYMGLYALQHRGQESSGIAASDGNQLTVYKGKGYINDVFNQEDIIDQYLKGKISIGHNRYSTTGGGDKENIQPLVVNFKMGQMAVAHNGNLTNTITLRRELEDRGSIFRTSMDSEVILHLIAKSNEKDLKNMIIDALKKINGAYSLLFMTKDSLIAVRDPYGIRPLCLGKLGNTTIVSSESCGIDIIGGEFVREVEPGEMVIVNDNHVESLFPFEKKIPKHCVFEYIYFARPDSFVFGDYVESIRREMGRNLALECPVEADIAISVPDSSNGAALAYAQTMGIPYEFGLIRNHYVGRTFIHPNQIKREFGVRIKFNPLRPVLKDKRVVMIDDSIVRGTTSKKIIKMIRDSGAKEVHFRIASPPIKHSCFYGVDTPDPSKLIAAQYPIDNIKNFLDADSLGYLSVEGMFHSIKHLPANHFCQACFNGNYPIKIENFGEKELFFQPKIYFS